MISKYTRKTVKSKTNPKNTSKRKIVYLSDKLLNSENLREDQDYLKNKQNQKNNSKDKLLYIFELPNVSSKYIGETEKNLNTILERAKGMYGVVFFDEADALFGKRSKINSHDRYANIEINYLLKKFQSYKGITFITPNFKKPITRYYVNKLDFVICFPIK